MVANLGSLVYYIRSKNADFKRGMKENKKQVRDLDKEVKKSQGTLQKYNASFKRAGVALTAFGAIVTGIGFKLAKMASDANEIQTRFNHIFGEMSDDANEWAENFSDNFNQSRSEIKNMMATLQDTLVPMGVMEDKAYELNKQIIQLTIDMSSFANVPLAQAMSDIQSAIVGQSRPMRKYGSVLTETRVKANALEEGIIETDRELTEQEKILSRVNLMMKDMTKATGDYERTQDSFANQLRETRNILKNIGEELGSYVLPEFNKFLGYIKDLLEWFNDLPSQTKRVVTQFTMWSGVLAGIVGPLALIVGYLPQIASGFNMIYGAMNPYFLVGGAVIVGLTAIYNIIKDIRHETDLLKTATEDLTKAQLEEKKALLESKITRLEDLVKRGGEEESILGPGLSSKVAVKRLAEYYQELKKVNKALEEYQEKAAPAPTPEPEPTPKEPEAKEKEERPSWLGEGPEAPEVDEEAAEKLAKEIMESGYEVAILEMEGAARELMELRLQKKRELRQLEERDIPESAKEMLRTDIEEMYERKRTEVLDRYAEERKQKEDEVMRNRFELEDLSLARYKAYLERRLDEYEKYTNEWMAIKKEIASLEEEPEDEFGIEDIRADYEEALEILRRKNITYGDSFDFAAAKAELLKRTIDRIITLGEEGMETEFFDDLVAMWKELTAEEPEEPAASLNWLTDALVEIGYEIEIANEAFAKWKDNLVDGLSNAIVKGESLLDVLTNIADQIAAMVIKKGIVEPIVDWGLGAAGLAKGHSGGLVTTAGIIPEMHSGGLAVDEMPAILQTGERVLNREENKDYERGKAGGTTIINQIHAVDAKSFQQMLSENKAAVTQLVGSDIVNNGALRKLIKEYG